MATRRGQGTVVRLPAGASGPLEGKVVASVPPRVSAPKAPGGASGTIWYRPDTPFSGDGVRVMLSREEGFTPQGKLRVPFRFQLPPHETISRGAAYAWSNFDALDTDEGVVERTRPGGPRLRTVSLKTMFLAWDATFQVWKPALLDPILAVRELEQLCLSGVRFRLRVHNPRMYTHDDVNMLAVLTQVTPTEEPGEPDTRYVQLEFQEYKPTEVERRAIHNQLGPWTHTIKDGDTLYKLAKRYYHRQSDWRRIARAPENGNLEHQAPSHNLIGWARTHHRKTLRIPQAANANTPVAA
jgi:hypothetical protein